MLVRFPRGPGPRLAPRHRRDEPASGSCPDAHRTSQRSPELASPPRSPPPDQPVGQVSAAFETSLDSSPDSLSILPPRLPRTWTTPVTPLRTRRIRVLSAGRLLENQPREGPPDNR